MDMENIRFFGLNTKKLPITLTTPTVREINPKTHQLRMETPVATYQMASDEILTGKTSYALIFQETETLFFEDKVDITSLSGYHAVTSHVTCDYNKGTVDSTEHIFVKGPAGNVDANGVWISDKGNVILFKKDVLATIHQKNEKIKLSSPEGARINQAQNTLTTLGRTTIYHQGNVLTADQIVAYYTHDKNNRIEKVVATGHVLIENGKQKMTGEKGTYSPVSRQIFMEGNVVLSQGEHHINGDQATLNLTTGESDLKAFGRIKGQILPNQLKKDTK